jgi:hypothetical protein
MHSPDLDGVAAPDSVAVVVTPTTYRVFERAAGF